PSNNCVPLNIWEKPLVLQVAFFISTSLFFEFLDTSSTAKQPLITKSITYIIICIFWYIYKQN
ncbi:hypothetical protein, partial [uncultured Acinetobacter sp.]|uniref:hypothetical protein n=1 Tax=uncultured Acinetobacter sp. TaxID=165433 RepID=UPI0026257AAF